MCQQESVKLLLSLAGVPLRVLEVLWVTPPQPWTTQVLEVDENRNVVTSDVEFYQEFITVHDLATTSFVGFLRGIVDPPDVNQKEAFTVLYEHLTDE